MSLRKKVTLVMQAVDNFSSPLKDVASATRGYGKIAKNVTETQRKINKTISDISAYKKQKSALKDSGRSIKDAARKTSELAKKIKGIEKPTAVMTREFNTAKRAEDRLKKSHTKQTTALKKLQQELTDAKVDTNDLTSAQEKLERQQAAVNRKMKLAKVVDKSKRITGNVVGGVARTAKRGALYGAGVFGLAAYAFKRQFIDTAAMFENLSVKLESIEGSSEKAKKAMDWINNFAATTPFALDDVVNAYTKAKAMGLDPMNGSLLAISDSVAKVGGSQEDLSNIVGALGKAISKGKLQAEQADQLLERGIPIWELLAKSMGKTTAEIQEMSSKGKLGTKQIRLLIKAMGDDAQGAARAQMNTWNGMITNLGDQWARFTNSVMQAGLFDKMKDSLKGLLDKVDEMSKNGELQEKAKQFGDFLMSTFDQGKEAAKLIIELVKKAWDLINSVNDFFGVGEEEAFVEGRPTSKSRASRRTASRQKAQELRKAVVDNGGIPAFSIAGASRIARKNRSIEKRQQLRKDAAAYELAHGNTGEVIKPITRRKRGGSTVQKPSNVINNNITVHPSPGMNEEQLAEKVAVKIAQKQERAESRVAYDR